MSENKEEFYEQLEKGENLNRKKKPSFSRTKKIILSLVFLAILGIFVYIITLFYPNFSNKVNNELNQISNQTNNKLLGQSLKIRNCILRNRIVLPPMSRFSNTIEGKFKEDGIKYYVERTNNVGLITLEYAFILDKGRGIYRDGMLGMLKENIPIFQKLTSKIHEKNSSVIIQIAHCGVQSKEEKPDGPSNFDFTGQHKEVEVLTKERINEIYNEFIDAALVAKQSGFDGVELHAAHAYLLNQFYSPISNKRTDEYGGNVENRIRLTCDIVKGIRKTLGDNFMISVRLGAVDYNMTGGNTIKDAVYASKLIEKAGADMISISEGHNITTFFERSLKEEGVFKDITREIKKNVHIPILLTGGIKTKEFAEKLLENNYCDLVGVGRPLLKNPNYVKDW